MSNVVRGQPKSVRRSASGTSERGTRRGASTGLEIDPHSKRSILDLAEWYARLATLAELREAQREQ
jgi:hypothetical protein